MQQQPKREEVAYESKLGAPGPSSVRG
jgi:hypothetical protein